MSECLFPQARERLFRAGMRGAPRKCYIAVLPRSAGPPGDNREDTEKTESLCSVCFLSAIKAARAQTGHEMRQIDVFLFLNLE